MFTLFTRHPIAALCAILFHVLIAGLFFFSFDWSEKPQIEDPGIPISLTTSDSLEPQANNVAEQESAKAAEQARLKEIQEKTPSFKRIS